MSEPFRWTPGRDPLTLFWRELRRGAPIAPSLRFAACMEAHARECEADSAAIAARCTPDLAARLADAAAAHRLKAAERLASEWRAVA